MIPPDIFFNHLQMHDIDFFTGVPDSLLKSFCAYLTDHVSAQNHVVAANEGAAVGLGVGYHLATGKIPLVYMQNSGLGNAINPLMSIADSEVYAIPLMLVIGWRGAPGYKDEPQHIKQGRVMMAKLDAMEIPYELLDNTAEDAIQSVRRAAKYMRRNNAPFALVVKKGMFVSYKLKVGDGIDLPFKREDAVKMIVDSLDKKDVLVATTGMASREVFEYRERKGLGHEKDFLTVGGMGHASQIALGIAMQKSDRTVCCIDGDGAALMHMGSMAINGQQKCQNFKHIIINNGAHDSVGGQPTVGFAVDFTAIARAVGYETVLTAETAQEILQGLTALKNKKGPAFLEIRVKKGSRKDLGRPTITPRENKKRFMTALTGR